MRNQSLKFIKSLESYKEGDADIFFGRDAEIEALHAQALAAQLLLVYGQSGTGKTSLIHCGLNGRFGAEGWHPLYIQRHGHLLEAWAKAVGASDPSIEAIEAATSALMGNTEAPLYIIFDQFEELFLQAEDAEIQSFFQAVKAIRTLGPRVRFIFVCREEFLANFSVAERHLPDILTNRVRILLMSVDQMSQVLAAMLRASGRPFEPEFLSTFEKVLRTEGQGTDLAGFQVYIEYLLAEVPADTPLTAAHIGGRNSYRRAMERYITRQLARLSDAESALALLKRLVSSKGTKLRIQKAELCRSQPDATGHLLDELVDLRLLRFLPEAVSYELMHDALAKSIFEKFSSFDRERVEVQEFVRLAHQRHLSHESELTDADLEYIAPLRDFLVLSAEVAAHLEAAFEARDQRQRMRRRTRQFMMAAASVTVAIIGYIAVSAQLDDWQAERKARAAQLASLVLSGEVGHSEDRYELAREAYRLDPQNNKTFEALMASAHHPTLAFDRFPGVKKLTSIDTALVVGSDSLLHRLKYRNGRLEMETFTRFEDAPKFFSTFGGQLFGPFGYILPDDSGASTYNFADVEIDRWSNNSVMRPFWSQEKRLLGVMFEDGEVIEVRENGTLASRGRYTGNLDHVSTIRLGNKIGIFGVTRNQPADSVVYLVSNGATLEVFNMFPNGRKGLCEFAYRVNEASCLCYTEASTSSIRLSLFNNRNERVFDDEIPVSMKEFNPGTVKFNLGAEGDVTGLFLEVRSSYHHFSSGRTVELSNPSYVGEHGDILLTSRSEEMVTTLLGSRSVEEVTLINRRGDSLDFEATHCLGWIPGDDEFVLGKAAHAAGNYTLSIHHWTGALVRSITLPLENGPRLLCRVRESKNGKTLVTFEDRRKGETHCLLFNSDWEVLGQIVIPDGFDEDGFNDVSTLEDVEASEPASWLMQMSEGLVALKYNPEAAGHIWPVHRTFFADDCPDKLFHAEDDGLQCFTWQDGAWAWSRFASYPGLSEAGPIASVHCSGDFVKLQSGRALRSASAGGARAYEIPAGLADWQFSQADLHPVEIQDDEGKNVLAWIQLGDDLHIDTTDIPSKKWRMDEQTLYAADNSWGRDSSAFFLADLRSGQVESCAIADGWGCKWFLTDAVEGNLVLSRWVLSDLPSNGDKQKEGTIGPSLSILWNPRTGEVLDSIPWIQALGRNIYSSVRVNIRPGVGSFRPDMKGVWRASGSEGFERIDVDRVFQGLDELGSMNFYKSGMKYRAGAFTGNDRIAGTSFCLDESTGAVLHWGPQEESCHIIDADYAFLESSGMYELRPRSVRAVDALFQNTEKR